ncbi:FHA domain-containing protein [Amycolatopsis sp. QT-25]|uniref:FHA domain-containing protein n=1 Tax=Amycolatopsis sp. QT-25 TaxID=3034022 RepID=UPI0023EDD93A|nr:FHA domain-containing protein [Amycolatopsis sp. QT-25]WET76209.1 FHA domain-containing protein [Amycolatopsis sp. QT-25]
MCSQDSSEIFDDEVSLCPKHLCHLVEVSEQVPPPRDGRDDVSGRDTEQRTQWSHDRCWHCGEEAAAGNTQCTKMACGRSLTPPHLHIKFAGGEVELSAGVRAELGRLGEYQRLFQSYPNVSRAHAVVQVRTDGTAWIEPLPTPNGTFLNDVEIQPALSRRLASGDRIRFARNAEGSITLYER